MTRKRGFPIVSRSSASVTLHLAPSARGSDLVQATPRWARRSGPMALGVEQARHTHTPHRRALAIPTAARSTKRTPHGCAQVGFDRPRLGGRVVPAADAFCSPLGWGQHPKTAPRRHTALPASLFLLLKGCTIGHIAPPPTGSRAGARRGRLGARTARKVRTSTAARPPQGCRTAVLASQGAHRLLWLLRRRPLRWPLLRRLAGGTAAGGRCTRAFPRGRRRAARAQLCWYTARVVTQPRRTGGAVREARAISYF